MNIKSLLITIRVKRWLTFDNQFLCMHLGVAGAQHPS